jgi:hypothetical protein
MMDFEQFKYEYFEKGYVVSNIPQSMLSAFWYIIHSTEWVNSTSVFKEVPSWYVEGKPVDSNKEDSIQDFEKYANQQIMEHAPRSILDLAQDVSCLPLLQYLKIYRPQLTLSHVHLWNGAEGGAFHQDIIDGSNVLVLCYFTDEMVWDPKWGGSITLQKQIDGGKYTNQVYPNTGTMVIINNDNPLFMHKVELLNQDNVNRYTFAFSYKWTL